MESFVKLNLVRFPKHSQGIKVKVKQMIMGGHLSFNVISWGSKISSDSKVKFPLDKNHRKNLQIIAI